MHNHSFYLEKFEDSKIWSYFIRIPDEIALNYVKGNNRRIICTLNEKHKIPCALIPSPKGYFILISQKLKKQLSIELGDEIKLQIEKDHSKYGMPIAKEFEICLKEDPIALKYFEALSPGKQRNLIYLVNQVKSSEIKIRRSLAIIEHLIIEDGQIEYKRLNQLIKQYNRNQRI